MLAPALFGLAMSSISSPRLERFPIAPFHDGESLAVFGLVLFEIDVAWLRLRIGEHLRRHVLIVLTHLGFLSQPRTKQNHEHRDLLL